MKRVYNELFGKYTDINAMSEAHKEEFETLLSPLGLNWRTPAFSSVVHNIKEKYDGKVPETREELKTLPGVGEYVAGAVLSVAYNKQEWIVDSNVVRLFKRYFDLETSKEGRRDKHVIEIAKIYAKYRSPKKANLALLDFSSLICKMKPLHNICVLSKSCKFYSASTDH